MKQISNEEFNKAYSNPTNIKIMTAAARKYKSVLGDDTITCQIQGLWTALQKFDDSRGMRFTTYLFDCVKRRCYAEANRTVDKKKREISMPDYKLPDSSYHDNTFVSDMLLSLPEKDAKLLTDRYLANKTLLEIGTEYGVTLQAIQQRLGTLSKKMRRILAR